MNEQTNKYKVPSRKELDPYRSKNYFSKVRHFLGEIGSGQRRDAGQFCCILVWPLQICELDQLSSKVDSLRLSLFLFALTFSRMGHLVPEMDGFPRSHSSLELSKGVIFCDDL